MKKRLIALLLVLTFLIAAGCSQSMTSTEAPGDNVAYAQTAPQKLRVYYIDVGQGDSILIQTPGNKNILIDAGPADAEQKVLNTLKTYAVNKVDILIATHPHEDHIGSMKAVVEKYSIGKIYMPKVAHNTETYSDLLQAISNKGLKVSTAQAGVVLDVEKGISAKFLAPNSTSYEDLNNYSAVLKLTYNKTSFLFTGDAAFESENEMLAKYKNELKSDAIKLGHHGSKTSSSTQWLSVVKPKWVFISVGKGNTYGHPASETISRLNNVGAKIYRTDLLGTITATSDGIITSVDKNPSIQPRAPSPAPVQKASYYIGNKNSKIFHRPTCKSLPVPKNQVKFTTRTAAVKAGYRACKICKP